MFARHVYPDLGFFFGLFFKKLATQYQMWFPASVSLSKIPSNSWFNYRKRILTSAITEVKNQRWGFEETLRSRVLKMETLEDRRGDGLDLTAGAGQVSRWGVGLMGQRVCHAKGSWNWRYRSRWTPFWEHSSLDKLIMSSLIRSIAH